MITAVAFQTRARTIDHLGREQIADCPTAITELWKNAFDAYARSVELHIFDGDICTAALVDDGHGMSREEFEQKWLVVGTESKATNSDVPAADRNGLAIRQRQGQKGIGRLSAAALGPLMLLVSKRSNTPFVASLIDWRLFENPFLFLNDIRIPVVEFATKDELHTLLPRMFDRLMGNIWGDGEDSDRTLRLTRAWAQLDALEKNTNRSPSTREAVETVLIDANFTDRQLERWPVWSGESEHGTAMLVADAAFDLQAQLHTKIARSDEQAAEQARMRFSRTLINFTDPFSGNAESSADASPEIKVGDLDYAGQDILSEERFRYSCTAWEGSFPRHIVSDEKIFSLHDLMQLEHVLDGEVDELGTFRGRVKAFGRWLDDTVTITAPFSVPTRSDARVGAFTVRVGTFEQVASSSTHEASVHEKLVEQAQRYSGFMVYRNGLRVLPYGREDNDFFEIEHRRGRNAGREFWSIRRIFGRVSLSRYTNPNLKDKAGREGFIDNKAAKVFRDLVINTLMQTARHHFGTASSLRQEILPQIQADRAKQRAEEEQKKVRTRKRKEFRKNLDMFLPEIKVIRAQLEELATLAKHENLPKDESSLLAMRSTLEDLKNRQAEMSLGSAPSKLGSLEESYKEYRSNAARVSDLTARLRDTLSVAIDTVKPKSSHDIAYAELSRNAAFLQGRLRKWSAEAKQLLSAEMSRLTSLLDERNKAYHAAALPFLSSLDSGDSTLTETLRKLEFEKERHDADNSEKFEAYISTLALTR